MMRLVGVRATGAAGRSKRIGWGPVPWRCREPLHFPHLALDLRRRGPHSALVTTARAASAVARSNVEGSEKGGKGVEEGSATKPSWRSLGLGHDVTASLVSSGFAVPSPTQVLAVPQVLAGRDVVVAAETGSGKTIAYLAPIMNKMLILREGRVVNSSQEAVDDASSSGVVALVLCPNVQLCKQVSGVAKALSRELTAIGGKPGPRVFDMTEDDFEERESDKAAIVVCTPSLFENRFVSHHKAGTPRVDLNVKFLVLDETDMLLTGGFEPVTMSILDWCQWEDKELKIDSVLENAKGMTYEDFQRLPYKFRRAAQKGGIPGMIEAGWAPQRGSGIDPDDLIPFDKCQYTFAGATIPDYGTRSVEHQIQKICPSARWVRGEGLHNPSTFRERLVQEWFEVPSTEEAHSLLADRVDLGSGRVIAFNKDVRSAMECADILRESTEAESDGQGLAVLEFHRRVPLEERMRNLETFKSLDRGILVCTDAASRGLDIPDVALVIQVEFAGSAVDYLHRIGRTARAGKKGKVVNISTPQSKDLVRSVRRAIEEGRPVQDAFSRKRSFRKKIKKEAAAKKGRGQ